MRRVLLVLLSIVNLVLYSQDVKVVSIDKERSDTLLYGIDQEVKEVISTLSKEEITGFDRELKTLLNTTYDESIKSMILEYFSKMKSNEGEEEALKIFDAIIYEDEYTDTYAVAAIKYLSDIKSEIASESIDEILDSENDVIIKSALRFIGENNLKKQEEKLLSMFEDEGLEDSVFLEVIKTLGQIKSEKALDLLIPYADDSNEETTIRNAVCFSLGEIGSKDAIPVLKRCLADRNNYLLRRSALAALAKFPGNEYDDILIESLRDPNWQIRYDALKSIAQRKVDKSFDIVKYKALKDPEDKIKKEAFMTIGDINSDDCKNFLREVYTELSFSDTQKIYAITKLIEHNVDWIFPEIEKLYNEKNSDKRKPVLDETLRLLAKTEYKFASDLYGKMLNNDNYIYRLYAIQGIRLNRYSEYRDKLKSISEKDENSSVKKHALAALDDL